MKVWYHVIAALVGLAIAALIVWVVFGNASKEGATQDGAAPGSVSGEAGTLCGTLTPAGSTTPAARAKAGDNLPSMFGANNKAIPAISKDHPDQQDWVERVHAAAGLCTDEIRIETGHTKLSLGSAKGVSDAQLGQYAAGALAQAFTAPFDPLGCTSCKVEVTAALGSGTGHALVSTRAWRAYQVARRARHLPLDMRTLQQFQASSSFRPADLTVTGW